MYKLEDFMVRTYIQRVAVRLGGDASCVMRAYSVDLREKIVDAVLGRGMSKEEAARTFGVGISSVKRYVHKAQRGESLAPGIAPGKKRKLNESGAKLLEVDLHARPAVSYEQRAEFLCKLLGVKVSKSTICRMIKRMGYTRKKGAWVRVKEMSS
jgi:transposase